ncbi:MAG: hypothetical protein RLZZ303_360 [Candidatus Hydrogenedentota bacterium]|jgi:AbrB family looped-hinge helix DNA binding protein
MRPVKVSSKYQIVISREVRESLKIQPGQQMQVFELDGRIEVVPVVPVCSLRGRFKGMTPQVERDKDRV